MANNIVMMFSAIWLRTIVILCKFRLEIKVWTFRSDFENFQVFFIAFDFQKLKFLKIRAELWQMQTIFKLKFLGKIVKNGHSATYARYEIWAIWRKAA